jgi:hypothetical protein
MNDRHVPGPRVSLANVSGTLEGEVNDLCHSFTGGVKVGKKHIMGTPHVVAIFWGQDSNDVTALGQLLADLVTGPFMNGLVQYGVGRGSVTTITVEDDRKNPAPATLDKPQVLDQLNKWFQDGTVSPAPSVNETNLLYFLFPPTTTEVKDGDLSTKSLDSKKAICGYHASGRKSNSSSENDDLFWAIVGTSGAPSGTGTSFANSLANCVSHELAEAFSDRDEHGYLADNGCEIGDICETKASFRYRGWTVEQYWSNWDNNCIHGDQPVSLRRFLGAIGFDIKNKGLLSLNTPVINLEYIASRMR